MDYTGNIVVNCFAGTATQQPMERGIIEFSKTELFAMYVNVVGEDAVVAIHRASKAGEGEPLEVVRNPIAQTACRKVEAADDLAGYEFVTLKPLHLPNGYTIVDLAIGVVTESDRVDANGKPRKSRYRLTQPKDIARFTAKRLAANAAKAAPAPAPAPKAKRGKSDAAEF